MRVRARGSLVPPTRSFAALRMTALRIAFAWKRERDGGGPGDPAPVGRAGRREPEGADHLVELARVVVVADCRVDLVSLDLPVHPHPERDGERGAAQLFGWRVEREGISRSSGGRA